MEAQCQANAVRISGLVWDRSNHAASPLMASCHTTLQSGCRQMGTCCALSVHSQEGQVSEAAKPQSFIILFTPQKPLMCLVAQSQKSGGYPLRASPLAAQSMWSKSADSSFGGQPFFLFGKVVVEGQAEYVVADSISQIGCHLSVHNPASPPFMGHDGGAWREIG